MNDQHKIYPNPFTNSSILEFNYKSSHTYNLHILNSAGQLIKSIDQINSGTVHISGKEFSSGIYFYQLLKDDKEMMRGKLIKSE